MSLVTERTQYLNLQQIEAVCTAVASRLLVGKESIIPALRRELISISANGLRSSALGQGLFGAHAPRPGVIALAGPGGVGKSYLAELIARVAYGERFGDHLIPVNCRAYFAGRFPPLPRAKLESGPLAVISLEGVEVLTQMPPVAALWADAIRHGRAPLPASGEQGQAVQTELAFGRCLIIATANVARSEVSHIGFRPDAATQQTSTAEAVRTVQNALTELLDGDLEDVLPAEKWLVLPPMQKEGMRRLVDLQLGVLSEMLPRNSPSVEISEPAAARAIELALASPLPNKAAALVDLMRGLVEPPVNAGLLEAAAPLPMRVRVSLENGEPHVEVSLERTR